MPLREPKYKHDIAILKDYGGRKRKITLMRVLRTAGIEDDAEKPIRGTVNDEKLDSNISRAKAKVFEYAYCNEFEYFVTLTIDQKKYDRKDLKTYYKKFSKWLRDYSLKHRRKIEYLFIPELHDDGESWHMHGFIRGIPEGHLEKNRNGYLDWPAYREKFGYMSIDKIRDRQKAASYITKYISKDLSDCIKELNAKMYYCSKGLKKAEVIKKGLLNSEFSNPDYENEWVKVKWFDGKIPMDALAKLIR